MHRETDQAQSADLAFAAIAPFLLISFVLAWGLFAMFAFFPAPLEAIFGPVSSRNPLFILAVYAPAIAAITLVLVAGGWRGLGHFLSRLLLWRCPAVWYLILLIGIPAAFLAGSAVKGNLDPGTFSTVGLTQMLGAMAFMLVLGPMEELGWRGVALPLLQRKMTPFLAAITLGMIWGLWNLPAFYLGGTPQSTWGFAPFFGGTIAISLIVTPMFNAAKGSILLPALMHFQLNNPLWPDAQPYDSAFFAALAAGIVWMNRDAMFTSNAAMTEVIPRSAGLGQSAFSAHM